MTLWLQASFHKQNYQQLLSDQSVIEQQVPQRGFAFLKGLFMYISFAGMYVCAPPRCGAQKGWGGGGGGDQIPRTGITVVSHVGAKNPTQKCGQPC